MGVLDFNALLTDLIAGKAGDRYAFMQTFTGNLTTTASREYAVPFILPAGRSVSSIQCVVNTAAASSVLRFGWRANDDAWPAGLVSDLGTVDASTTGVKSLAAAFAPPPGRLFWITITAQGGTPAVSQAASVPAGILTMPRPSDWGSAARHTPVQDGVTGALPASFSTRGAVSAQASTHPGLVLVLA